MVCATCMAKGFLLLTHTTTSYEIARTSVRIAHLFYDKNISGEACASRCTCSGANGRWGYCRVCVYCVLTKLTVASTGILGTLYSGDPNSAQMGNRRPIARTHDTYRQLRL